MQQSSADYGKLLQPSAVHRELINKPGTIPDRHLQRVNGKRKGHSVDHDVGDENVKAADAAEEAGEGGLSFKDAEEKTFSPNVPSCSHPSLTPHPDLLVESASLRGAEMPPLTQRLRLPSRTLLDGLLTTAQLDGVARACAQHELLLPDGSRKGFLLGDGAGVGKGRQQAAVIFHNANHGRRRAVWLSVSADLIDDARRDLYDIGAGGLGCHDLRGYRADQDLSKIPALREGVIFCTYSLLVSGKTDKEATAASCAHGQDCICLMSSCSAWKVQGKVWCCQNLARCVGIMAELTAEELSRCSKILLRCKISWLIRRQRSQ